MDWTWTPRLKVARSGGVDPQRRLLRAPVLAHTRAAADDLERKDDRRALECSWRELPRHGLQMACFRERDPDSAELAFRIGLECPLTVTRA